MVVFNNSSLNFVEVEMKAAGFVNFGTGLDNPDFAAVAQAIGMLGQRVEQPADLEQALCGRRSPTTEPAVVDVVTARQELWIPPAITVEQARGFTLYAIRTSWPAGPMNCSTSSTRTSRGEFWTKRLNIRALPTCCFLNR